MSATNLSALFQIFLMLRPTQKESNLADSGDLTLG